jgi:4-hydroxybenzoate-CoA ligase
VTPANGNAAAYFVDRHAVGERSGAAAFVEGDRSLTYRALFERAGGMAGLYDRCGLRPEDRAAMVVLDTIDFPVIFWGSLKAGVAPVPLNTLLTAETYAAILRDSGAKALFVSKELLPILAPAIAQAPALRAVFCVGGEAERCLSFEAELARGAAAPTIEVSPDQCAFWLYSSGSTGKPKGVRHVHSSLKATADCYGAQVLGLRTEDIVFSAAKLFFAYGLGNAMTFPMAVGATTILNPARPTPDAVLQTIARSRPTVYCGVPTLYAAMLARMEGAPPAGFDRLRVCVSAGEALPAEIGRRWTELTGVEILDGVGSTEMLHIYVSNRLGAVAYGASGVPVPGYAVRLVDERGRDVEGEEIGEMLVNGPSAAEGYWNQREKSRSTFEGQWTRTGDKYLRRPDGRYVYCGRTDDMFKVGGIWVSPFEVEQALITHPDVFEAAVVAERDEDGLEKPVAFIVVKGEPDRRALIPALKQHVKDLVGTWKYPRRIEIVDELPKTATGKVQRFKLRRPDGDRP